MKVHLETRLQAPIETVVAVLTSAKDAPLWQRDLDHMEVVRGGPNQIGSLARLYYVEHGQTRILQDELLDCEPDRRWRSRVSGNGMIAEVEIEVEDSGDETLMRISWDGRPEARLARMLFLFLRPTLRRRIAADLRSLNQLVRKRAAGGAG